MIYLLAILLLTAAIAIKLSIASNKRLIQNIFEPIRIEYVDCAIVVGIGDFYCSKDIAFPIRLKSWQKSGDAILAIGSNKEQYKIVLHSDCKNESLENLYIRFIADGLLIANDKLKWKL